MMETAPVIAATLVVISAFVLYETSRRGFISKRTRDLLGWVIGIVVGVMAIASSPLFSGLSIRGPHAEPSRPSGKAVFYDPLKTSGKMTTGQDAGGRSYYDQFGYVVESRSISNSWSWIMKDLVFTDAIIETTATPLTHGNVTGYGVVFGWDKSTAPASFYQFQVQSLGRCRFLRGTQDPERRGLRVVPVTAEVNCQESEQDSPMTIRIEIQNGNATAFVNGKYVVHAQLAGYRGGLIGFTCYNGGDAGSGVVSRVRFTDLSVWNLPR